jgi:diguanylate cyclase
MGLYSDPFDLAVGYATRAVETMARLDIAPYPTHYAIWYDYESGQNPELKRMIDIMLTNGFAFDESKLYDLHEMFFSSAREHQALHHTSQRFLETLDDVQQLVATAARDAGVYDTELHSATGQVEDRNRPLSVLLEQLKTHSGVMAERSHRVSLRLQRSATKIRTLERTLEDVRREATIDSLTELSNRRSFDALLRQTAGEAMNSGETLSLLMVDVDHFKHFNDRWGHQVGDAALRLVAQTLTQSIRGRDVAARYGGEEFTVILPGTNLENATSVGENIRAALERARLSVSGVDPAAARLTASLGVSCYDVGEPLSDWLRRADEALYRAKHEGRNRVVAVA